MSSSDAFPETLWTLINDTERRGDAQTAEQFRELIGRYRQPIFRFLIARGYREADAEDLTHDFLAKFWEKEWETRADRTRGRFRSYVLTLLKRFLADRSEKRAPRQESFERGHRTLSKIEDDGVPLPASLETAEDLFMREWAFSTIRDVQAKVKEDLKSSGRELWYEAFLASTEVDEHGKSPSQVELAVRFGMSRDQVRYAISKTNEAFLSAIRKRLADETPWDDVANAVNELLSLAQ